jgi:hypothetical protein
MCEKIIKRLKTMKRKKMFKIWNFWKCFWDVNQEVFFHSERSRLKFHESIIKSCEVITKNDQNNVSRGFKFFVCVTVGWFSVVGLKFIFEINFKGKNDLVHYEIFALHLLKKIHLLLIFSMLILLIISNPVSHNLFEHFLYLHCLHTY